MKRHQLIGTLLLGLLSVSPALADGWYEHHDRDGDGRWNYNEFRSAHNNYYRNHAGERRYEERELKHHFNRFDSDHDGYVTREQVREFHHW